MCNLVVVIGKHSFEEDKQNFISALEQEEVNFVLEEDFDKGDIDFDYNTQFFYRGYIEDYEKFIWEKTYAYDQIGYDKSNYEPQTYYQHYNPDYCLNSNFVILPFWKLYQNGPGRMSRILGADEGLFIKPLDSDKSFTGNTLGFKWFHKELEIINTLPGNNIKHDQLIFVSPKKHIDAEYRLVMRKDKLITYSFYSGDEDAYSRTIFAKRGIYLYEYIDMFLEALKIKWWPDEFYTLDIALHHSIFSLIEINSLNCAGWYDSDYVKIVQELKDYSNENTQ